MMSVREAAVTAREATTPVAMMKRPPEGGRNRPGPGSDLDDALMFVVPHHHPARIAREAPGRFRGTARPIFHYRLSRLIWIRESRRVHVDDDLVAITGCARIDPLVERRLGEQGKRIGLPLRQRRGVAGRDGRL